jgi:hypothetical protein
MVAIAISLLWVLIGIVVLGGIIAIVLYYGHQFVEFPTKVDQIVWAVFVILVLIYILTALVGGGGGLAHPNFPSLK